MLPWLLKKNAVSTIISRRHGQDTELKSELDMRSEQQEEDKELEIACEQILKAIEDKSALSLKDALSEAFKIIYQQILLDSFQMLEEKPEESESNSMEG